MPPINVIVSGLPSSPSTLCLHVGDSRAALPASLVSDALIAATGLPPCSFFLRSPNGLLRPHALVTVPGQHTAFVAMCLRRALPGGKGGFGAMLRGGAAPSKKTTNFDACRDLQGRRLRHVRDEIALREYARAGTGTGTGTGTADAREAEQSPIHHTRKRTRHDSHRHTPTRTGIATVDPEELEHDLQRIAGTVQSAVADAVASAQSRRKRARTAAVPDVSDGNATTGNWMMDYEAVSSSDSEGSSDEVVQNKSSLRGGGSAQVLATGAHVSSAQPTLR